MKKIFAILAVLAVMMACFVGCSKKCDVCGESGAESYEILGETVNICDNCSGKSLLG